MTQEATNLLPSAADSAAAGQAPDIDETASAGQTARPRHSHARAAAPTERRPLWDQLFHRQKSTVRIGDVSYLDGAELTRPQEMPARVRTIMFAAMAVAALIGGLFLTKYFDQILNEPIRQQQALQENLTREVSLDLPQIAQLMPENDEDIMTSLSEAGLTLYERTPVGTNPDGGFEVIKLPPDMTVEEAGLMYVKGIDRLAAADAVRLLKGAWTLDVSRKAGTSMRVRYADFDSGSIEAAVQNAMQAEGLENAKVTDSGVDDSGNTYQAGTVKSDGEKYTWRVSVIDLSEVYDISGLPNTAFFVGIRFSA